MNARSVILSLLVAAIASSSAFADFVEIRGGSGGWSQFGASVPGDFRRVASKEQLDVGWLADAADDNVKVIARGGGGATFPDYGLTGDVLAISGVTDLSTDDLVTDSTRVWVTNASGATEYNAGSVATTVETAAGHVAGEVAYAQDTYWSVKDGAVVGYNRSNPWAPSFVTLTPPTGHYIDVTVRSQGNGGRLFALTDTGFDEYDVSDSGGSPVASHTGLFTGATGISIDGDQDDVFVSATSGLFHLHRDGGATGFSLAGKTVIDGTTAYLDVDVPRADVRHPNGFIVFAATDVFTTQIRPTRDLWIRSADHGASLDNDALWVATTVATNGDTRWSLLEYDLSGLDEIVSARLVFNPRTRADGDAVQVAFKIDDGIAGESYGAYTAGGGRGESEVALEGLGGITLPPGGLPFGQYATGDDATDGDLAMLNSLRTSTGTLSLILKATNGAMEWNDGDNVGGPGFASDLPVLLIVKTVPEPGAGLLAIMGLIGLVAFGRKSRRQ